MAITIGELLLLLSADPSKMNAELKSAQSTLSKFADNIGKKMKKAGMVMSVAITAPLVLIGKKALDMAMNVVEAENLFEVSMGGMADAARKWSKDLSDAYGLNEFALRKMVGTFNVMLDSMGLTEQQAYNMSTAMTELAYDMASFYNLPTEEAFIKLQAGISGEAEGLKRLGIILTENFIKTWAYKNGLVAQGEELTEQQKILARYGALMEQTSKAQGDMARTLKSPANQLRIFKEQLNMVSIDIGALLIPMFLKVLEIVKPYIKKFRDASDSQKQFAVTLGIVFAAAGPVLIILGQMLIVVRSLTTAFIRLTAAVSGLGMTLTGLVGIIAAIPLVLKTSTNKMAELYSEASRLDQISRQTGGSIEELRKRLVEHAIMLGANEQEMSDLYKIMGVTEKQVGKLDEKFNLMRSETERWVTSAKLAEGASSSLTGAISEQGDAAEDAAIDIDSLIASLFALYNLSQSVTEATWAYEEAQKATAEAIKKYGENSKEVQEAIFDEQDAREALLISLQKEYGVEGQTLTRQRELQAEFKNVAEEAVKKGEISGEAFLEMAKDMGLSRAEIEIETEKIGIALDKLPKEKIIEIKAETNITDMYISEIRKRLNELKGIEPEPWSAGVGKQTSYKVVEPWSVGVGGKQKGGSIEKTGLYLMHKDEEVIPAWLAKKIPGLQAGTTGGILTGILASLSKAVGAVFGVAQPFTVTGVSVLSNQIEDMARSLYKTAQSGNLTDEAFEALSGQISLMSSAFRIAVDQAKRTREEGLNRLKEAADVLSISLTAARTKLEYFISAPLIGMKAMDDQAFTTEMQIKDLQLRILKMKYAGNVSNAVVESLERQLSYLQMRTQMMDLERDLKFMPLTKQIKEQLLPATRELTFEEIINGAMEAQIEIGVLTPQLTSYEIAIKSAERANAEWAASIGRTIDMLSMMSLEMMRMGAISVAAPTPAVDITARAAAVLSKAGITPAQVAAMGYTRVGVLTAEKIVKGSKQFGGVISATGLYQLHRGEIVTPKNNVSRLGGGINITVILNKPLQFIDEAEIKRVLAPIIADTFRREQKRTYGQVG